MRKSAALELAVLGLLAAEPLHGYELRKRLAGCLDCFREVSFGALYPALGCLLSNEYIGHTADSPPTEPSVSRQRGRINYTITAAGREHLAALLAEFGSDSWDDEGFAVRLAFFNATEPQIRRQILIGRRAWLAERKATLTKQLAASRPRLDHYALELQHHGIAGVQRELDWIDALLADEGILTQ